MTVRVGYHWHLRQRMAEHGLFVTTDLVPLLAERGVTLSREQVYRLVVGRPQRLSLSTCGTSGKAPGLASRNAPRGPWLKVSRWRSVAGLATLGRGACGVGSLGRP